MRTRSQSREPRPPPPEGPPVVIEPLRIEYPFQEDPTVRSNADTRTNGSNCSRHHTEGFIELRSRWKHFGQNARECLKIIESKSKVRQTHQGSCCQLLLPVLELIPVNTVTTSKGRVKSITTRSGVTIQGPKTVIRTPMLQRTRCHPANNGSTEDVQPPVVQIQSRNPNPEPNVAPVVAPVPHTKPTVSLPYPSRRDNEKSRLCDPSENNYSRVETLFLWDDPFLFKICADPVISASSTAKKLLYSLTATMTHLGNHGANLTAKKIFDSWYLLAHHQKDAHELSRTSDSCQRQGKTSQRDEIPQNQPKFVKSLTYGASTFMGPFPSSRVEQSIILVAVAFVQNGMKAKRSPPMMPENMEFTPTVLSTVLSPTNKWASGSINSWLTRTLKEP
ncbi:hypothetical protein Tco_0974270 [Tanacetum coccineum]|uniref:Uncharacterized protein n=1 Tax=Tanacetum coccineum TaxID=301880 RepID=A0ABQ5EBC5_9ASTR